MNTLVLFKLPGKQGYATCSLDSLSTFPRSGHSYMVGDRIYQITEVIEPISSEGGNALLLKLMNLDRSDAESIAEAVQSMINLDDTTGMESGLENEPDKVILVKLKGKRGGIKLVPELELVVDVQQLSARVPGPDGESEA